MKKFIFKVIIFLLLFNLFFCVSSAHQINSNHINHHHNHTHLEHKHTESVPCLTSEHGHHEHSDLFHSEYYQKLWRLPGERLNLAKKIGFLLLINLFLIVHIKRRIKKVV